MLYARGYFCGAGLIWLDVREQGIKGEDDGAKQADGEGRHRDE